MTSNDELAGASQTREKDWEHKLYSTSHELTRGLIRLQILIVKTTIHSYWLFSHLRVCDLYNFGGQSSAPCVQVRPIHIILIGLG